MKSNNRFLLKMLDHTTSSVVYYPFFFWQIKIVTKNNLNEYKLAEFWKNIGKVTGVNYSLNALFLSTGLWIDMVP